MSIIRRFISLFSWGKHVFCVEGENPERALLRLKNAQIPVYNVKKTQKNRILFRVNAKESEKVFAIFPNVCYNIGEYTSYTIRKIGTVGPVKYVEKLHRRIGLFIGALLFCVLQLYTDTLVLGVKFVGSQTYAREALATLHANGIKPFACYDAEKTDVVCATLLRCSGVEYCSVQKRGYFVYVEMRTSPFARATRVQGDMRATRSGTLLSLTALSGTVLKNAGEKVERGEPLVGAYVCTQEGEQRKTDVVARAYIACEYEETLAAETEEQAFAMMYLQLQLSDSDQIQAYTIVKAEQGYCVKCTYTVVQTLNL